MVASIQRFLLAAYRKDPPVLAQDAPADRLQVVLRRLTARWLKRFDRLAEHLADHFARDVRDRSDAALRSALKTGGMSVQFKATKAERDVMAATVAENVRLIKSIPEQYLTQVEGAVMRSVQTGRDIGQLAKELETHYGVTKRRAAFIARDQNNKATAAITRARQDELGITEAIWLHSGGGKHPRPSHVRNSGQRYKVETGWYDPDAKKWIWPGTLPNCRCVAKSVISYGGSK